MKNVLLYMLFLAPIVYPQEYFWEQLDTLKNETVFSISLSSTDRIFLGSWLGKISFSTDNGKTWNMKNGAGINNLIYCLFVNSYNYIFAGTIGGGLLRSTDYGESWIHSGLDSFSVISIKADSKNNLYAAAGGQYSGIFKSSDNGETWDECGFDFNNTSVQSLAVSSSDQIFAATLNGIYVSPDSGKSWIQKNNGLTNKSVYSIAINSDDCIFAGTFHDGEIFYSSNSGESWIKKSNSLNKSFVRAFAFHGDKIVYAASCDGIFRSADNGNTWSIVSCGPAENIVQTIAINEDEVIYAGTWAGGAYRNFNPALSYRSEKVLPKNFALEQNYPNPFNPSTKIRYSIPKSVNVSLKIFDILGNEIAVLINEEKTPGSYEMEFSASGTGLNLASGVYFYSLQAQDFSSTKKFILLK